MSLDIKLVLVLDHSTAQSFIKHSIVLILDFDSTLLSLFGFDRCFHMIASTVSVLTDIVLLAFSGSLLGRSLLVASIGRSLAGTLNFVAADLAPASLCDICIFVVIFRCYGIPVGLY